jgi:hypothetical protein
VFDRRIVSHIARMMPNQITPLDAAMTALFNIERQRREASEFLRSMKGYVPLILCMVLAGCSPTDEAHMREVRADVTKAGGSAVILTESRTLFARVTNETDTAFLQYGHCLDGLPAIKSLGDVFNYFPKSDTLPGRVLIRRHNSHRDTYFIQLVNPEEFQKSEPRGFRQIVGNIGFIEPASPANQSPAVGSGINQTSAAAGSDR